MSLNVILTTVQNTAGSEELEDLEALTLKHFQLWPVLNCVRVSGFIVYCVLGEVSALT